MLLSCCKHPVQQLFRFTNETIWRLIVEGLRKPFIAAQLSHLFGTGCTLVYVADVLSKLLMRVIKQQKRIEANTAELLNKTPAVSNIHFVMFSGNFELSTQEWSNAK